jgi:mannitol/fructose-specific phosphotransferase system IIA component (Ntr-type)
LAVDLSTLADFTRPELIIPRLSAADDAGVLSELLSALDEAGQLGPPKSACLEAFLLREKLSPTAEPFGWAFPHARLENTRGVVFALGGLSNPIPWFSSSIQVSTVFLFVIRPEEISDYLKVLAGVARLSKDTALRSAIAQGETSEGILEVLRSVPLRHRHALSSVS